jgi:AraC-like DNA-binding protein
LQLNQNEIFLSGARGLVSVLAPPLQHPQAFWAEFLCGIFDVVADDQAPPEQGGECRARLTSNYLLAETRTPRLRLVHAFGARGRGGFDGFALRLTVSGRLSGRAGDKFVACGPGDLLLLDLLEPVELEIAPEDGLAEDVTLWIPRPRLLAAVSEDRALSGLFLPAGLAFGSVIGRLMAAMAGQNEKVTAREMEVLIDGLLALLAKVVAATPPGRPASAASTSFLTVRRYIDRNLRSTSLDADALSKTFGISRAALYRLFEPVGGIAIYIREARLRLAWQEIVYSDGDAGRIGIIAYQLGFKNVSAFNRAFRRAFGVNPTEARQTRLHVGDAVAIESGGGGARLADWLDRLGKPH